MSRFVGLVGILISSKNSNISIQLLLINCLSSLVKKFQYILLFLILEKKETLIYSNY